MINPTRAWVLLAGSLVLAACSCAPPSEKTGPGQSNEQTVRRVRSLHPVIDFVTYKRLFHKSYPNIAYELNHQKYFLARAFRAFVSRVKYKYRKMSYYLAVNHMSDLSPGELDQMDNNLVEEQLQPDVEFATVGAQESGDLPEFHSIERVEDEIEQYIETHKEVEREISASIGVKSRKKRAAWSEALVSGPYCPMEFKYTPDLPEEKPQLSTKKLGDEMYFDHRESGCLFEPRDQGKCGSCYAFALVAFMEWLYCKQTGQRVALSEQYVIDCGRKRVGSLNGCSGGGVFAMGTFAKNFGMEMLSDYPYRMRDEKCPYHPKVELLAAGRIRFGYFDVGSIVNLTQWETHLQFAPIVVGISTKGIAFKEYGGGVFDGSGCRNLRSNHIMLVVGHGREDGQDYWLIRNSYSVDWGEGGYWKLAKSADCIKPAKGFMYGTRDGGRTFLGKAAENLRNDRDFVSRLEAGQVAAEAKSRASWKKSLGFWS